MLRGSSLQAEDIQIEIPRGTIKALAWGPKNGKPILALHGWLDNAASFIPIAKYFHDYRFIAIDLMGHGHSTHPPQGTYFHFIDYVADVVAVMDKMSWEQCALLGHSLGAGIATIVAGAIPDRVCALGLIDGIGPITLEEPQFPDLLKKAFRDYARLPAKKLPIYSNVDDAVQARQQVSKMHKQSVELLVNRGIKEVTGGYTWRTDPRLLCSPLIMYTENQIPFFLQSIQCNVCLIRPSNGWPFDEKVFADRVRHLDNIEIHKIDGEHHVHIDHPDTVGNALKNFFQNTI